MTDGISNLVRPFTTWALVGAMIYMAVVQKDTSAMAAVVTLGVSTASFWFGQRSAEKAMDAIQNGTGSGSPTVNSGGPTIVAPQAPPTP